jgi:DNA primase
MAVMDASQLKELLNKQDIFDLLVELGGEPKYTNDLIYSRTICHNGQKHKLIYYPNTNQFHCFTDCQCSYDIFSLIQKIYDIDFPTAFRYVAGKFGIDTTNFNYSPADAVDTSFIRKFQKKEPQYVLKKIPKTLLNSFYKLYHHNWVEDGISIETMKKFGVLFSIKDNKIIIPHFDPDGRLIGIRGRALNPEEIEAGRKYMPIFHKGEVRKHPTGANIYGLHVTKEQVIRHKTIILFESEKGPMQLDTMLPNMSIGGGISGSALTNEQVKILLSLGIEHVVLGLDKEFEKNGTEEEKFYKEKIKSGFIDKLYPYFHVSVLWDTKGLLNLKDAPTDRGKDIFLELWNNKIHIN